MQLDYLEMKLRSGTGDAQQECRYVWAMESGRRIEYDSLDSSSTFYISIPLEYRSFRFGTLIFAKDLDSSQPFSTHILRRIEQLRRTSVETIAKLTEKNGFASDTHQKKP